MGLKRTDEFRADEWVTAHRDIELVFEKDLELARENERLRRENRILKEEYPSWPRPSFGSYWIAA